MAGKIANRGKFIVIEGLDGSGATTQVQMVIEYLRGRGVDAYSTKEPTDNVIGGLIRGALSGVFKLPDTSLQLLFSADRGHHISRFIEPVLNDGSWVVCDRYLWSTVAFGSISMNRKWLLELQKYFRTPELSIFLKVDPKECVLRIKEDRYDLELFEKEEKLRKVWNTYAWLARKHPANIKIVNGNVGRDKVSARIIKHVEKLL